MIRTDLFSCVSSRGPLPLVRLEVQTRIVDHAAANEIIQAFVHGYDLPIVASYTFPLPPDPHRHDDPDEVAWFRAQVPLESSPGRFQGIAPGANGALYQVAHWRPELPLADLRNVLGGPLPVEVVSALGTSVASLMLVSGRRRAGLDGGLDQLAVGLDGRVRIALGGPVSLATLQRGPVRTANALPLTTTPNKAPLSTAAPTPRKAPAPAGPDRSDAPARPFWKRWVGARRGTQ